MTDARGDAAIGGEGRPYPAFVIADADAHARSRCIERFPIAWFFIQTSCGEEALRYYRQFRNLSAGVFLAEGIGWDGIDHEVATLDQVVRRFVEEEPEAKIVVLAELPDAAASASWKERGAHAVLAHPTRRVRRDELFRQTLESLTFRFWDAWDARGRQ